MSTPRLWDRASYRLQEAAMSSLASIAMTNELRRMRANAMKLEVRPLWKDGPLREWAANKPKSKSWTKLAGGGYAGCYVCERCQRSVEGLYRVREPHKWLCGPCREALRAQIVSSIWRVR